MRAHCESTSSQQFYIGRRPLSGLLQRCPLVGEDADAAERYELARSLSLDARLPPEVLRRRIFILSSLTFISSRIFILCNWGDAIRANRTPQTTGGGRYLKWIQMWQSANGCSTESKHSMLCSSTLIKILHGPMMVTADPLRWTHSRLLNFYW